MPELQGFVKSSRQDKELALYFAKRYELYLNNVINFNPSLPFARDGLKLITLFK
jgi:hypothetical protein